MATLKRDGWIVEWIGSEHTGHGSGSVWYSESEYDDAVHDAKARERIYGQGNVKIRPSYVIG